MIQTIEPVIDEQGKVQLLHSARLPQVRRSLVKILEEESNCCRFRNRALERSRFRRRLG